MSVDTVAIFKKAVPKANTKVLMLVDDSLKREGPKFGINTPKRIAAFMAQASKETGEFYYLTEIWNGKGLQANYEGNVKSLGNTQPGDGFKFRGRGIFQTTGRANYAAVSKKIFGDLRLLNNPDLLAQPEYATISALHFWNDRNLNKWADLGDNTTISKLVNGKYSTSINERNNYFTKFLGAISISPALFITEFLKKKPSKQVGAWFGSVFGNISFFVLGK